MRPFYGRSWRSSRRLSTGERLERGCRSGKFSVFGLSSPYNSLNAVSRAGGVGGAVVGLGDRLDVAPAVVGIGHLVDGRALPSGRVAG